MWLMTWGKYCIFVISNLQIALGGKWWNIVWRLPGRPYQINLWHKRLFSRREEGWRLFWWWQSSSTEIFLRTSLVVTPHQILLLFGSLWWSNNRYGYSAAIYCLRSNLGKRLKGQSSVHISKSTSGTTVSSQITMTMSIRSIRCP